VSTSLTGRAVQNFDLQVRDRQHLDAVLRRLSKVRGVLSVERVRT
jgi:(p)ppGpp synthase/HD superfamily hydrolase